MQLWVCLFVLFHIGTLIDGKKLDGWGELKKGDHSEDSDDSCQRLPCPMSLRTFRSQVVGEGYTRLLGHVNYDIRLDLLYHHANFLFNETDNSDQFHLTVFQRDFFDDSTGPCLTGGALFTSLNRGRANFERDFDNFTITYFSRNPRNYILETGCNNVRGDNLKDRSCEGLFFAGLYSNRVPAHFLDWKGARREMFEKTGLRLSEFFYTQQYLPCGEATP